MTHSHETKKIITRHRYNTNVGTDMGFKISVINIVRL